MANDARGVRRGRASAWKICGLGAVSLLLTFLCLALCLRMAPDLGGLPAAGSPVWPSVSC